MQKFTTLTGIAAHLPMINVDTDMIIPKQYLKTIKRTGLGSGLFAELRYDEAGKPHPHFVLHRAPYHEAKILITGENFGCGSSREHAPWALLDFGISCVIAPSFADIFYNNCFKNGVLPIRLPEHEVQEIFDRVAQYRGYDVTVNLQQCQVRDRYGLCFAFEVDGFRRDCLLNGWDDIALTLRHADKITAYEAQHGMTPSRI